MLTCQLGFRNLGGCRQGMLGCNLEAERSSLVRTPPPHCPTRGEGPGEKIEQAAPERDRPQSGPGQRQPPHDQPNGQPTELDRKEGGPGQVEQKSVPAPHQDPLEAIPDAHRSPSSRLPAEIKGKWHPPFSGTPLPYKLGAVRLLRRPAPPAPGRTPGSHRQTALPRAYDPRSVARLEGRN